ncbi:MAG: DUF4255 domain-containing protein [Phormidesmis priestleyi]|uniref:DUF4255 domain-containing protein n=1 Tax=Phormidesmis priestleyi TaxID=268141 RepID=A0A2W4XDM9_9CYAN|nr:MAG: DUF4255 domain-containing protein [Phormidesmis priestleyi]
MSNALAIAAVTTTLRRLIEQNLPDTISGATVTTKPLDKALKTNNGPESASNNQLNLFLYQTELHSQLRNDPLPEQAKSGETGYPPLALNLYYLLTAYGQDDDDTMSHQLLGQAMSTLHDHPIMTAADIRLATETVLPTSNLHQQIHHVRITPQPISLEDLTKLWATFQTQYRISTTYQVSVVLIESLRPTKAPQPVLARGSSDDDGVGVQPNLVPPYPEIVTIILPHEQPSLRLSDAMPILLVGQNFVGGNVKVMLRHRSLLDPVEFPISESDLSETQISFTIPNAPELWPAGRYGVSITLEQTKEGRVIPRSSKEMSLSLAPEISALTANRDTNGVVTITVNFTPAALLEEFVDLPTSPSAISIPLEQRVFLSLLEENSAFSAGDSLLPAESFQIADWSPGNPIPESTTTLTFRLGTVDPGTYRVRPRLRIDDVESFIIQDYAVRPPRFVDYQNLVIP